MARLGPLRAVVAYRAADRTEILECSHERWRAPQADPHPRRRCIFCAESKRAAYFRARYARRAA